MTALWSGLALGGAVALFSLASQIGEVREALSNSRVSWSILVVAEMEVVIYPFVMDAGEKTRARK